MKKVLCFALTTIMIFSFGVFTGCNKKQTEALSFGLGIISDIDNLKSAKDGKNGQGELSSIAAAVLVDSNGKIVKCTIDSFETSLAFSSKGKYIALNDFKTKKEKGNDYGMVKYGGAKKEWYEQVDILTKIIEGKTMQDVKALVATNGKGKDDVINAGCTITVSDFIRAVLKAVNNAKNSKSDATDKLNIGISVSQSGSNAENKKAGTNEVEADICAMTIDQNGKITASITDAFGASVSFDKNGVLTAVPDKNIPTKLELGDSYGMVEHGNAKKEWYAQAKEFDSECIGKTYDRIGALVSKNGKGNDALINAGCTINLSNIVKAALKAAK